MRKIYWGDVAIVAALFVANLVIIALVGFGLYLLIRVVL